MVEFDKILEEMGSLSWKQKIQLVYMLIPCIAVATHMGSMVYLGHLVDKRYKFPMEKELQQVWNVTFNAKRSCFFTLFIEDNVSSIAFTLSRTSINYSTSWKKKNLEA